MYPCTQNRDHFWDMYNQYLQSKHLRLIWPSTLERTFSHHQLSTRNLAAQTNLMTSHHSPSKSPSVAFQPYWEGIVKCTIRHGFKGMQSAFQEIPGNAERLTNVCSNSEETLQSGINHIQLVFHVTHRMFFNKAAMIGAIMGIPISGLSPNTVTLKKLPAF